jgi:HopA1 effector protein family
MIESTLQLKNNFFCQLEDICRHINLLPDFSIIHSNYEPYNLESDAIIFLKKLPKSIQNQHINLQLRSFLYDIYFKGSLKSHKLKLIDDDFNKRVTKQEVIENNTVRGINRDFYNAIDNSNIGKGYYDNDWQVLQKKENQILVVEKDELLLHIQSNKHLKNSEESIKLGDKIAVLMPKNQIEYSWYIAVGDGGLARDKIVNIYFNFTSEGALFVMESLTKDLNQLEIPFQFKVINDSEKYTSYDSGVLQFNKQDYSIVINKLQNIYDKYQSYFQDETPMLTKTLAKGLSLAEEPTYKFSEQEDFGMNRCRIIANALIDAWEHGDNSKEVKMAAIRQHFSRLGIVMESSYLNPDSKDIYIPFN